MKDKKFYLTKVESSSQRVKRNLKKSLKHCKMFMETFHLLEPLFIIGSDNLRMLEMSLKMTQEKEDHQHQKMLKTLSLSGILLRKIDE